MSLCNCLTKQIVTAHPLTMATICLAQRAAGPVGSAHRNRQFERSNGEACAVRVFPLLLRLRANRTGYGPFWGTVSGAHGVGYWSTRLPFSSARRLHGGSRCVLRAHSTCLRRRAAAQALRRRISLLTEAVSWCLRSGCVVVERMAVGKSK